MRKNSLGRVRGAPRPILVWILLFGQLAVLSAQSSSPTALHWAAGRGHSEIVALLIRNGAEIESGDHLGRTALHLSHRHPHTVELLLEAGANANARDSLGATPLHMGIRVPETTELLIRYGAEISAADALGRTPLDLAVRGGSSRRNLAVVSALVDAGAR